MKLSLPIRRERFFPHVADFRLVGPVGDECERGDLNPHGISPLAPQASASAIPPRSHVNPKFDRLGVQSAH